MQGIRGDRRLPPLRLRRRMGEQTERDRGHEADQRPAIRATRGARMLAPRGQPRPLPMTSSRPSSRSSQSCPYRVCVSVSPIAASSDASGAMVTAWAASAATLASSASTAASHRVAPQIRRAGARRARGRRARSDRARPASPARWPGPRPDRSAPAPASARAPSRSPRGATAGTEPLAAPGADAEAEIPVQGVTVGSREGAPGHGVGTVWQIRRQGHDELLIIVGGNGRGDPGNRVPAALSSSAPGCSAPPAVR